MINRPHVCPSCGGPIDRLGRTVASFPSPVSATGAVAAERPAAREREDDSQTQLSPTERFNQAIDRRDRLVRDRRSSDGNGRRATDRAPLG